MNYRKEKHSYLTIALLIYLLTTGYLLYIGRYETIYGVGVAGVIAIQLFGLLIFGATLLFSKLNVRKSIEVFVFAVSLIQCIFIVGYAIEQYKPTYVITIPPNYEGFIYLFVTNQQRSNVFVDEHGIGYVGSKGKATWEIQRGNETITNAFSTRQQNEITIRDSSNTLMIVYDVSCLEINESNDYPPRQSDYEIKPCMDSYEFLELVEQGMIEEKVLRKKVWNGNGDDSGWVFDPQKSRL